MADTQPANGLIGVLDMGASAIRLVVAEIDARRNVRVIEEASRGVLLGRDTFSAGVIRSQTVDAALEALDGFRHIMNGYGVADIRAVATSAVREARNADMFLDRIQRPDRHPLRDHQRGGGEPAGLPRGQGRRCAGTRRSRRRATLLIEVGGGSTSLTALRRGQPTRSGVYALGSVRLRQQLDLRRHTQELQVALLNRYVANVVEEIRVEIPLDRVTHVIAIGGDVRFVAAQLSDGENDGEVPEIGRAALPRLLRRDRAPRRRQHHRSLPPAGRSSSKPCCRRCSSTGALVSETAASSVIVSGASLRGGVLIDVAEPKSRLTAEDFARQVLASADTLGHRYRYDREHGHHVAMLATRLFDQLRDEHGLGERERLLLQVAALLHDVGMYISLRAHHKHSQYILGASQIFGLSNEETAIVSNIVRYHRRGLPQDTPPAVHRPRPHRSPHRQQAGGDPAPGERARCRACAEGPRRAPGARAARPGRWSSKGRAT